MKKIFLLFVAFFVCTLFTFASDFVDGGFYYTKLGGDSVELSWCGSFSGEMVIPSSVINDSTTYRIVAVGPEVFKGCNTLKSITIPNSVTTIGEDAFYNCYNLKYVRLGNNVKSIGYRAFFGCTELASINIHSTINSVGESAFHNCTSLPFNTHDNAQYLGNPQDKYHVLVEVSSTSINSCDIHETTTVIADGAFRNCINLNSIFIPLGVTHIGKLTFSGCSLLKEVILPNSIVSINEKAFQGCRQLPVIKLPESVIRIENEAFKSCVAFTKVTIPKNVTNIGDKAFTNCTNIEEVIVKSTTPPILGLDAFHSNILITVPCGSQETYEQSETRWSEYFYYQEEMFYTISVLTVDKQQGIARVNQGPDCETGTAIIEAIPYDNYVFAGWNDGNMDNPRIVTVISDVEYTATFKDKSIQTILPDPNGDLLPSVHKVLENGTIYILRNGDKYTIDGRKVE